MEEKKSAGFLELPNVLTTKIYEHLSSHELIQMKLAVGADTKRSQQQDIQNEIKRRVSQISEMPDVNLEERENVWRIYECFRALEDNGKRNPSARIPSLPPKPVDRYTSLRAKENLDELTACEIKLLQQNKLLPSSSFPKLPNPPQDIWADLRNKQYIRDLTPQEMQLLSSEGLFSTYIPDLPDEYIDWYADIRTKFQSGEQLTEREIFLLQMRGFLPFGVSRHEDIPLPFPELPPPPADHWVSLQNKRTMRELTLLEIHCLFTHDLLKTHLVELGRSNRERALLIMSSPFLKEHLPSSECELAPPKPWWFSRIVGAIVTGVWSCFLSAFIRLCVFMAYLLWDVFLILPRIIIKIIKIIFSSSGPEWNFRNGLNAFLAWCFFPLYCAIHPLYSFFTGLYLGGKLGITACCEIACSCACHSLPDWDEMHCSPLAEYTHSCSPLAEHMRPYLLETFRIHKLFQSPPPTIADIVEHAERIKQQSSLNNETLSSITRSSTLPTDQPHLALGPYNSENREDKVSMDKKLLIMPGALDSASSEIELQRMGAP